MERCFTGTASRIKGADFAAIFEDLLALHRSAYPAHTDAVPLLRNPGNFHYRNGGEAHLNTPQGMVQLQQASRLNSRDAFKAYTKHVDEVNKSVTLRGVLKLKVDKAKSIPISEVGRVTVPLLHLFTPLSEVVWRPFRRCFLVTFLRECGNPSETAATLPRVRSRLVHVVLTPSLRFLVVDERWRRRRRS